MHSIAHLDFSKLIAKGPNPKPFDEDLVDGDGNALDMRFVNVIMNRKQLKIKLTGKVTEDADRYEGGKLQFKLKPDSAQLPNLERLESVFENTSDPLNETFIEAVGFPSGVYEHRFTVGENDSQIRLKFVERDGKITTGSNYELEEDGHRQKCISGAKVSATVTVGFYFHEVEKKYGMYFKLIDLDYNIPIAAESTGRPKPVKRKAEKKE